MQRTAQLQKTAERPKSQAGLVVTAAWLGLSALALAQEPMVEKPTVIEREPKVEQIVAGAALRELHEGDEIDFGEEIRTGPRAWVAVAWQDNVILDIGSDTTAIIERQADELKVDLKSGRLIVALAQAFRGVFRIQAPSIALGIRGTLLEVLVLHDGTTRLWVYEGEVELEGLGLTVRQGHQILVKPDGEVLHPSPISPGASTALLQAPEATVPADPPLLDQVDPRLFTRDF